jgi:hypothetical protein
MLTVPRRIPIKGRNAVLLLPRLDQKHCRFIGNLVVLIVVSVGVGSKLGPEMSLPCSFLPLIS